MRNNLDDSNIFDHVVHSFEQEIRNYLQVIKNQPEIVGTTDLLTIAIHISGTLGSRFLAECGKYNFDFESQMLAYRKYLEKCCAIVGLNLEDQQVVGMMQNSEVNLGITILIRVHFNKIKQLVQSSKLSKINARDQILLIVKNYASSKRTTLTDDQLFYIIERITDRLDSI